MARRRKPSPAAELQTQGPKTLDEVAAALGVSVLAVKVFAVLGAPGGLERLSIRVPNAAAVAAEWNVHRSTVSDWQRRGMPIDPDGSADLAAVYRWGRSANVPAMTKARDALRGRQPKGDLTRGLCRVVRCELAAAVSEAIEAAVPELVPSGDDGESQRVAAILTRALCEAMRPLILQEHEAETLITDCAGFV